VDRGAAERDWRDAALISNSTLVATPAELTEISRALMDVLRPYFLSNRKPDDAPEDAREVHMAIRMAPRLD
jgi:hypothetical protein